MLQSSGRISDYRGKVWLSFSGYSSETRSVWDIPQCRSFTQKLFKDWPEIVFFLKPDENLRTFALCNCKVGRQGRNVYPEAEDLRRFVVTSMTAIGRFCVHHRIDALTQEAFLVDALGALGMRTLQDEPFVRAILAAGAREEASEAERGPSVEGVSTHLSPIKRWSWVRTVLVSAALSVIVPLLFFTTAYASIERPVEPPMTCGYTRLPFTRFLIGDVALACGAYGYDFNDEILREGFKEAHGLSYVSFDSVEANRLSKTKLWHTRLVHGLSLDWSDEEIIDSLYTGYQSNDQNLAKIESQSFRRTAMTRLDEEAQIYKQMYYFLSIMSLVAMYTLLRSRYLNEGVRRLSLLATIAIGGVCGLVLIVIAIARGEVHNVLAFLAGAPAALIGSIIVFGFVISVLAVSTTAVGRVMRRSKAWVAEGFQTVR